MRKTWVLGIIALLLCSGCSQKQKQEQEFTYFLFAAPLEEHPVWLQAKEGFFDACEELGVQCDWIGPKTIDTDAMNDAIQTGILQKADGIITQGVVDDALIQEAKEKQIPIILVDSDMPESERTAYFGKDFHHQAELLLEDIEQMLGKDEYLRIAIQVAEESFDIAKEQIKQVNDVFATHPGGFEIVQITSSKSDQVRAKREWAATFQTYPDLNVAINFAGESVEACYESAASYHLENEILLYGVDSVQATLDLIKAGKIQGTIATSFYDYGYDSVKFLAQLRDHPEAVHEAIQPTKLQLITKKMLEENDHESKL